VVLALAIDADWMRLNLAAQGSCAFAHVISGLQYDLSLDRRLASLTFCNSQRQEMSVCSHRSPLRCRSPGQLSLACGNCKAPSLNAFRGTSVSLLPHEGCWLATSQRTMASAQGWYLRCFAAPLPLRRSVEAAIMS
jgi:hypothetical protein